jgi:predicted site-specific integrase-resolvase
MRIELPNGDVAIPNAEFADRLGVVVRTLNNYDREGLPYLMIGGKKYRPLNEGLAWIASRIRRRNPRRTATAANQPAA